MCFKTKTSSVSSQTSGPEAWVRETGQGIFNQAQQLAQQPYQGYTGEKVAGYNGDFTQARDLVANLGNTENADYGDARKNYAAVAGADDPSKSVQDYMNPWLEAVLAPQIRKLQEQGALNRMNLNRTATMSGAFGDSRHGVLEAQLARDEAQNIGDTTGKAYAQAWDTATQARNTALQRILSAGQAQQGLGTANDNRTTTVANLLAGLSDKQRQVDQAGNDAEKAEFERSQKYPYEQLTWLMQLLNQTPANQVGTGVNTQKGTDNSGLQLAGKVLGAALIPGA